MEVYTSLASALEAGLAAAYQITDVVGKFKFAIGAGTLGMHYTLRNPLTIKVSKQVNQVEILKQERAILANSLGALGIRYLPMAIRT